METAEYANLVNNINVIDSEFRNFPRQEASNPENQRKLRACISLMHSEFETYFELMGSKIISTYSTTMTKKQKSKLGFTLSIYNSQNYDGQADDINVRINNCIAVYKSALVQNNGIKQKDILKILLPIGISLLQIDNTWLTSMNSFGSLRGELIHKNLNQITKLIGYQYIDETVYRIIIPGTKKLDELFLRNYPI